jgi:hypothetical protein
MNARIIGDDMARLISKTDRSTNPDGCWHFTGARSGHGYGNMFFDGSVKGAHRVSYMIFCGHAPKGMHVDHMCHTRDNCSGGSECRHRTCVRPSHLTLTTHRDNNLRGHGVSAENALKTHCPRGHAFDAANTYVRPQQPGSDKTSRDCRTCRAESSRRFLARKASA